MILTIISIWGGGGGGGGLLLLQKIEKWGSHERLFDFWNLLVLKLREPIACQLCVGRNRETNKQTNLNDKFHGIVKL